VVARKNSGDERAMFSTCADDISNEDGEDAGEAGCIN